MSQRGTREDLTNYFEHSFRPALSATANYLEGPGITFTESLISDDGVDTTFVVGGEYDASETIRNGIGINLNVDEDVSASSTSGQTKGVVVVPFSGTLTINTDSFIFTTSTGAEASYLSPDGFELETIGLRGGEANGVAGNLTVRIYKNGVLEYSYVLAFGANAIVSDLEILPSPISYSSADTISITAQKSTAGIISGTLCLGINY